MHYELDVYEGESLEFTPASVEHIQQQMDEELADGNFVLDPAFRLSHDDKCSVIATSNSDGAGPGPQYFVSVSFLGHLPR